MCHQQQINSFPPTKVTKLYKAKLSMLTKKELIRLTLRDIDPITVTSEVNGIPIRMDLDTGATVTLISARVWEKLLNKIPLLDASMVLRTYTGEPLKIKDQVTVKVQHCGQEATCPQLMVDSTGS